MAARKFTGQTLHRNKEGILEFKKSDGLKKSWKPFSFKVSASTYLLCSKTADLSKPDEKLLLANVTQVLPSASKGASFPFEVVFKGRGSPWKLNASSNEERISWMEAILPGSSSSVTNSKKVMEANSPPAHTSGYQYEPPPAYTLSPAPHTPPPKHISPNSNSQDHVDPNTYSATPKRDVQPGDNSEGEEDDEFISASLGPTSRPQAQEYLLPTKSQSLREPSRGRPGVPSLRKRGNSDGDVMKPRPSPRPRRKVSPQNGVETTPTTDDPGYVKMVPSPVRKSWTAKTGVSDTELPNYLQVLESEAEPVVNDDNSHAVSESPESPAGAQILKQGSSVTDSVRSAGSGYSPGTVSGDGASNLADSISQNFNHDQIGLLIQMLQQVRVDKQQSDEDVRQAWKVGSPPNSGPAHSSTSPVTYAEENSLQLRGSLQRALSYAPPLTERILYDEEDDEDSPEARPKWAKAVPADPLSPTSSSSQLDTLTDLQHKALYISKSNITDLKTLGEGQFGKVYKGMFRGGSELVPVAVKMTKKTISDYLQQSFLKEMSIMSQMMHPNIVRLYGLVNEGVDSPWIVLEYMEHGDLKSFLTKNERPIQMLIKYMVDVAMGMHYISERGLVHRDLAARNVLVGTNEICKVADFGLLREIPRDDSIYQSTHNVPCPIRWMPPESISDRKFSAASDVWSFGVLVWEMFNPTKLPYCKYDNLGAATKVNQGLRLPVPRGVPSIVAKIIKACWHNNPNKRPSFLLISTLLSTRTTV